MSFLDNNPPFQSMVRASGLAEVWTHSTDAVKFNQFGWRCTNKEASYGNTTLVGNWNEERFDNKIAKVAKPLPSQVCNKIIDLSIMCILLLGEINLYI